MDDLFAALQPFVDSLGGVGMAIVAAIDTSFFSLPTVNDLLIVWQTIKHPWLWWYYALMTTIGSVVGTQIIYYLGKRGGDKFLLRRLNPVHVARARAIVERRGFWAMVLIAFLPPPAPYKPFVLLAGVAGIGPGAFALAVGLGRGIRYLGEGWLARQYGDEAALFIRLHLAEVALWVAVTLTAVVTMWWLWRRRQTAVPD